MKCGLKNSVIASLALLMVNLITAQVQNNLIKPLQINANLNNVFEQQNSQTAKIGNTAYSCKISANSLLFQKSNIRTQQIIKDWTIINPVYYKDNDKIRENEVFQSLIIAADTNNQLFKNRIYICWADQKNGKNNWDVFLVYSDDEGEHWTEPILISYRPNHKNQMAPKLLINYKSGEVNIIYFDQQNYLNSNLYDVYLATSKNGGLKFDYFKLNENVVKIKNPKNVKLSLQQKDGLLFASWSTKASKSYFQAQFNDSVLNTIHQQQLLNEVEINNQFVFENKLLINFFCANEMNIGFELTQPIEPNFTPKIIHKHKFKKGNNQLLIDMQSLNALKGNYTLTLYYKGVNKYIWITEE